MASFIIHHLAGESLLKKLKEYDIKLVKEQETSLLLGNLIVDSTTTDRSLVNYQKLVQKEKQRTHFRDENNLCINYPNLDKFFNKYKNLLYEPSVLGYYFHLYTDYKFFNKLFSESFELLDKNSNITDDVNQVDKVRVIKNNRILTRDEFYNPKSEIGLYNDYTMINKYLIDLYNPSIEDIYPHNEFINPGIEEIDYQNIDGMIEKLDYYIKKCRDTDYEELNIFDIEKIKEFIENTSDDFIREELMNRFNIPDNVNDNLYLVLVDEYKVPTIDCFNNVCNTKITKYFKLLEKYPNYYLDPSTKKIYKNTIFYSNYIIYEVLNIKEFKEKIDDSKVLLKLPTNKKQRF